MYIAHPQSRGKSQVLGSRRHFSREGPTFLIVMSVLVPTLWLLQLVYGFFKLHRLIEKFMTSQ